MRFFTCSQGSVALRRAALEPSLHKQNETKVVAELKKVIRTGFNSPSTILLF